MEKDNITKKDKPTESQIQLLMSDWLGNLRMGENGNFTHAGKNGIKTETNIRDYLIGDISRLDQLDLMKKARKASETLASTLSPMPVTVQVGGNASYNGKIEDDGNGRHIINIATDYFDDGNLSKRQKAEIMLGLSAHEAAHSKYTDFDIYQEAEEKSNESKAIKNLKRQIWNIIEDERIEYLMGDERPGVVPCLSETKRYYFKELNERMRKRLGGVPTEGLPKLINSVLQAVRYPSELTREQVEDNFEELNTIRKVLTPYPLSPEACLKATERIMDVIRDKAREEMEKQEQEQEQEQEKSQKQDTGIPGGQGSPDDGQQNNNQQQGDQGSPSSGQQPDKKSPSSEGDNGSPKKNKKPTKKQIEKAIEQMLDTQEGKAVMESLKEDENKSEGNQKSNQLGRSEKDFVNNDKTERMSGGDGAGGGNKEVFVTTPKGDQQSYMNHLQNVKRFIPAMARSLTCKSQQNDYVEKSQKRGKLDTTKLSQLVIGDYNIFQRQGSIKCSSASVCMLIDESGSMNGHKLIAAREAAILVNEAAKQIPNIDFFCYGYDDDRFIVYSEGRKADKWALGCTSAEGGTLTGLAMELSARRVRKHTQNPVLMLILTDGMPHDTEINIKMDEKLRTQGFAPVGVGIKTNAVKSTFKDYIEMNDISEFAKEIGKLTKNKLEKMLVRTEI